MQNINGLQKGFTLLSLLIGLNLTMLSALASLNLYTSHSLSTKQLKADSAHNRQLATSMMAVQREIYNAGFGIEDADASHVLVVNTAGATAGTSLLWRYKEGFNFVCRGLRESSITSDGVESRVLRVIKSDVNCNESTALGALTWTSVGILGQWPVVNELEDYITANGTLFSFEITTEVCSPYGMTARVNHLNATISAPIIAELNGVALPDNAISICLPNTYPI